LTRERDCQFGIGPSAIELHFAEVVIAFFRELLRSSDPLFGQTQLQIGFGHALRTYLLRCPYRCLRRSQLIRRQCGCAATNTDGRNADGNTLLDGIHEHPSWLRMKATSQSCSSPSVRLLSL
jgi:hypothetical protein